MGESVVFMEPDIEKHTPACQKCALPPPAVVEGADHSQDAATCPDSQAILSSQIFDAFYLERLRKGDEETAKHFNAYFRKMLRIKLWSKFGRSIPADLMDDVMAAALEKILNGEPRDPACLAAYVRRICSNLAKKTEFGAQGAGEINFDDISDGAQSAEEQLLSQEKARTVQSVLTSLKPRDRRILVDLFYNEMERGMVCEKYGITREQLRLILFRARNRFQKKWRRY